MLIGIDFSHVEHILAVFFQIVGVDRNHFNHISLLIVGNIAYYNAVVGVHDYPIITFLDAFKSSERCANGSFIIGPIWATQN